MKLVSQILHAGLIFFFPFAFNAQAMPAPDSEAQNQQASSPQEASNSLLEVDFQDAPTFIKSNSLTLKTGTRTFEYKGNVEVKQGDFIMNCDLLEGFYNEKDEVERMVAHNNVIITKGPGIRATSELAEYLAENETVVLTEGPELQQEESILTADLIRIFLKEDRSVAEGTVRVKLVEKKDPNAKDSNIKNPTAAQQQEKTKRSIF